MILYWCCKNAKRPNHSSVFSFKSMTVETKQSMLKKMLLELGQDPTSEEHLDDPRITSKFINIAKKRLGHGQGQGQGRILNANATDAVRNLNVSDSGIAFANDVDVGADEDGAFEQIDDDVIGEDKGEGMTGLTDRGTFNMKTKKDRSREETKSSW